MIIKLFYYNLRIKQDYKLRGKDNVLMSSIKR
jgi:hypothetical protein